MPKQRVTREQVVEAAFQIAREEGMEKVLVKELANRLRCSVQPIYTYCKSMEELRRAVEERTAEFVREYAARHRDEGDPFRSTGRAYLQLAREEPNLYRIFFSRRQGGSFEELYRREADPERAEELAQALGLTRSAAQRLHLHMLLYTTGVGHVLAAAREMDVETAAKQLEGAYQAFLRQAREETK